MSHTSTALRQGPLVRPAATTLAPTPRSVAAAEAAALRYVSDGAPSISRLQAGRGFRYRSPDGSPVRDFATRRRIQTLAIPPASTEVWICPVPRTAGSGRAEFLAQFPRLAGPDAQAASPDPADRLTFERSQLDLTERERHAGAYALLVRLRREDPVFRTQESDGLDGAVLGSEALVLRFFGVGLDPAGRLLCVNLGRDLSCPAIAGPLLAPPSACTGASCGPASLSAMAAPARPRTIPAAAGFYQVTPRLSSGPGDD